MCTNVDMLSSDMATVRAAVKIIVYYLTRRSPNLLTLTISKSTMAGISTLDLSLGITVDLLKVVKMA